MKWIVSLWQRVGAVVSIPSRWTLLKHRFQRKQQLVRSVRVDEFPENLELARVYLAGEGEHLWAAAMICPCGCGEVIELNLLKQVRPCWSIKEHSDGLISLRPSVWRQKGCRSHFVVRHGRIDWC